MIVNEVHMINCFIYFLLKNREREKIMFVRDGFCLYLCKSKRLKLRL